MESNNLTEKLNTFTSLVLKDAERTEKIKRVEQWFREHPEFKSNLDALYYDYILGRGDPDEKFNAAFMKDLLAKHGIKTEFTPSELLKGWYPKL